MACGNKLVTPNLRDGQLFDGHMIHKVFKSKALYVRPSATILDYNSDSEDTSSKIQGPNTKAKSKINQPKIQDLEDDQYDSDSCVEMSVTASNVPNLQTISTQASAHHPCCSHQHYSTTC
ncbi:hypothetical protein UPYG_G00111300 [Umbra pygmaea]|uniref:Uncharacterized protein n=1 Tax=Umbra pygmaea TaxID=75934 RepID=A0ABD0XKI9_UMBPY